MTENMKAFAEMVDNSPELQKRLGELKTLPEEEVAAKLIALARESGVELGAEDIKTAQEGPGAGVELSDEQLGQVAGGVTWGTDGITYDGSQFKYEFDEGRAVWVSWYGGIRHFRGKITGRWMHTWQEGSKKGTGPRQGYQPLYSVKYDDGDFETNIRQGRIAYV